MSTTYSWACEDCNVRGEPRHTATPSFGTIYALVAAAKGGTGTAVSTWNLDSYELEDHLGHALVVIDQYGDTWDVPTLPPPKGPRAEPPPDAGAC